MVFVLAHRHGVEQFEFGAARLDHEDLTGEVHDVDLAIRGGGRRLENVFALEFSRPKDFAGRFEAKEFFLVSIERIKFSFVKERRRHIAGELLHVERTGGPGGSSVACTQLCQASDALERLPWPPNLTA